MPKSIVNNRYPMGNPRNFRDLVKGKYTALVYQGDNGDLQFAESATLDANAWLPSGSIAHIENGVAKPGLGTNAAGKVCVPYIVKVGTEHRTVRSEKFNAAGGIITLLPLTGYFRLITTVFDKADGLVYSAGDLLTVGEFEYDGKTVYGITKAGADLNSKTIVGIVDGPVGTEVKQNDAVAFTAYFKPVVG